MSFFIVIANVLLINYLKFSLVRRSFVMACKVTNYLCNCQIFFCPINN